MYANEVARKDVPFNLLFQPSGLFGVIKTRKFSRGRRGTFLFVLMRLQSGQMAFWLSDPFQISRPLVCVSYVLKNIQQITGEESDVP